MSAIRRRIAAVLAFALVIAGLEATAAMATAPVEAPVLTRPAEGSAVSANPVLAWDAVPDAVRYRVELSTSPAFTPLSYAVTTYARHATPPTDLPLGTLHWRVRGLDSGSGGGPFATASFVKTAANVPMPSGPTDGRTLAFPDEPVVLHWAHLPGAKQYRVEVDDADDFIDPQTFITSSTSLTLTDLQPTNQWFSWHVQGISPERINTDFSPTMHYRVSWPEVPRLDAPGDGDTITDVVFSWEPVQGAATYDIEVSPSQDFATFTLREVVKGTRYAPPETLDNGSYFWRVRGRDARTSSANVGPWSATQEFNRAWESPADRVTAHPMSQDESGLVSTPTFRWSAARHASHYELQVSTDVNFSPSPSNPMQCFTNHTTFTPYEQNRDVGPRSPEPAARTCDIELVDGTAYWWRVRPLDGPTITSATDAVNGAWSNTESFTFQRGVPQLTSPAAGEPLVLRWTAVPEMDAYDVTIVKHGVVEVTERTHALSYSPTAGLDPDDGPFTWYVRAVDHNGVRGLRTASPPSFTLPATGPTTATPEPVGPQGLSSHRAPSLRWTPVTGADFYKVYSFSDGILTPFDSGDEVPFPSFTPTEALSPGTHGWKVQAWSKTTGLISTTQVTGTFVIVNSDLGAPVSPCTAGAVCEVGDTPTLEWDSAFNGGERAGYYIVYVALDPLFTNIFREYRTVHTSLTPRESYLDSQAGQSYFWFVRPCVATVCGPFNESVYDTAFRFRKRSPAALALTPGHGRRVADLVRFTWDDYLATNEPASVAQEARQYRIQVSTASDFSTVLDEQVVDQTEYTPYDLTYPEGPLYWRVQAIDGSKNALTWNAKVEGSERLVIKASPPTELHPSMFTPTPQPATPTLQWNPQAYAASYQVEVYKNADTNYSLVNRVLTQTTKLTAWTPSTALPSGSYAWRVRRLDADGRPGTWSSDQPGGGQRVTFEIVADQAPLIAPAADADVTTDDIVFEWGSVEGAVQYRIDVSPSPSFSPLTESVTTVMTSWSPVKKYADGTYFWRVSVIGGAGTVLSTSAVRTFDKDSSPPTVLSITPTTGVPLEGPVTVTFSEPVTGVSAATLVTRVASTGAAVPGAVSQPSPTTARFVPAGRLLPGQSYTVSLTAGVHDLHDNPLTPDTRTIRAATVVENGSPVIKERWDGEASRAASAGLYDGTATKGAASTLTFSGTSIEIWGMRSSSGGYADVYLDGVKQPTALTCYRAGTTTPARALLWRRTGLAATTHTLVVRARGTRPRGSKGNWVWIDNYRVGATVYQQESSSAVVESFGRVASASAYGGSYAVESGRNSSRRASYTMAFKGTSVTWYSTRSAAGGIARVYVDGLLVRTVSLYSSTTRYRTAIFRSGALADRTHTIKIVLMETKDARSTGRRVALDQLRVG